MLEKSSTGCSIPSFSTLWQRGLVSVLKGLVERKIDQIERKLNFSLLRSFILAKTNPRGVPDGFSSPWL